MTLKTTILILGILFISQSSFSQLSGNVYIDANGNGTRDTSENGVANLAINIQDDTFTVIDVLTTNANGDWNSTTQLSTGEYYIHAVDNDPNYPVNITISEGSNPSLIQFVNSAVISGTTDLGFFPSGILQGNLFNDLNNNGVKDGSDVGIPDVDVQITDAFNQTTTISTDAIGNWEIVVPEGNVTSLIDVTDPDFPFSSPTQTTGTNPSVDMITAGNTINSNNDGFYESLLVESISQTSISFYPNPVRESFYFKNYSGEIQIIDVLGKVVLESNVVANQNVDISSLTKGSYFIKLEQREKTIRLIKE